MPLLWSLSRQSCRKGTLSQVSSLHCRNTNELPKRVNGSVVMEKINFNGDILYNTFVNSCNLFIKNGSIIKLDSSTLPLASDLGNFPFYHDAPITSLLLKPFNFNKTNPSFFSHLNLIMLKDNPASEHLLMA